MARHLIDRNARDFVRDHPRLITEVVTRSLNEDIGICDITASLIAEDTKMSARVVTNEDCTVCGTIYVNEVFRQVDPLLRLEWHAGDGDEVKAGEVIFRVRGKARSILTAERCSLNFLQTLSGTATATRKFVREAGAGTNFKILDTRKTIPGLRIAQKYAVLCGGGHNHRLGLWDAFLIKENHIAACGGISAAVKKARSLAPSKRVEVETENIEEFREAVGAGADIVMLDDFSLEDMRKAVEINKKEFGGRAMLEASGMISRDTIKAVAATGVDCVSSGSLTKHVRAVDLSLRYE
uniref:Nicotinate-nucleotide pyrophosphorylase [carboxylating] n=1 Tax=Chromera velia CCMP2878 TaxID=1169474 RepID=A0A0G4IFK8_9ALVE|mmetsp:Transcript_18589/g.37613  ORF Transcript_18589/g.37613 Transcript_18589/m.37613 type:complete len:295 (+) Transcript_18589:209-1093(+)|eukprot:Cvel_14075.t1-p1 / transcript=Cvel_14075.t1 / gene=Cvel_14075 / organism=Chromera_velia_CCMP2878 / gene_product=Nicotinate-nucleotide pyrophosphorylase, putative / transcript_product=Nicotinate-nucleotide pyrophosphorylase, putative / location=Cvel_scaffold988:31190-32844(+) / protein_length=294 / sequence_SO=supercontig / SO=protein_coding / is_pseudo=false